MPPAPPAGQRLDSWKDIATYLRRSVATVQRWEQTEGLPVHRLVPGSKARVYAFALELDEWMARHTQASGAVNDELERSPASPPPEPETRRTVLRSPAMVLALAAVIVAMTGVAWITGWRAAPPPEVPAELSVVSRKQGSVSLSWTDRSAAETHFEIRRFDRVVATTPADTTTIEFTGLDAGTSFHWDVRACNARGCSPWHGVIGKTPDGSDAHVPPPPPGAVGGATDILFSRTKEYGKAQLHVLRADGQFATWLTKTDSNDDTPKWSPDRTRVAFMSDRTGFPEIFVMRADGSKVVNLTRLDPSQDTRPAWSPDGKRIAFGSTRTGDSDIWIMNADGSQPVNVTRSPGHEVDPAWSPDGTHIAFVANDRGADDIYVMRVDGTGRKRLTSDGALNRSPAWSPDGRRLAFSSKVGGSVDVWTMAADGTDRVNLTAALARDGRPSQDEQPSWSPDGRRLAFRSNRDGPLEIYAIGTDGSGLVKLTYWTGGDGQPDWGFPPRR